MTPQQYKLYGGMLRLFAMMGTGGSAWSGVRGASTGLASPTLSALASRTIRFLENNRIKEAVALPQVAIYTAPWWGLAEASVDVQAGDIYTNGTIAFLITGQPDTSQGFQVIPATRTGVPVSLALRAGAGFRAGLRIGAY